MQRTAGSTSFSAAALIPAFDEAPVIRRTIEAVVAAGFDRGDIHVVDDCSSDGTEAIALACGVRVFRVPANGGKARAQWAGLRVFDLLERYRFVVFLDGDTLMDPGFRDAMQEAVARDPGAGLYVGQVRSVRNRHLFSASRANEYTFGQDIVKVGQSNFNAIFVAPGCASMYATRVLRRLAIDGSTLAEDMDLTIQVHRAGERVVFVRAATVRTQDPGTLRDYHKQVLRWYRGFWQVILKHRVFGLGRKQMVDAYMAYVVLEALMFNRVVWCLAFLGTSSAAAGWVLLTDAAVGALIALYSAVRSRRADVLFKFPLYYWLSYLNLYAFLRAFVEVVLQRKASLAWNKVRRYEFDS